MSRRRYPRWQMPDDAKGNLRGLMDQKMYGDIPPSDDVEGLVGQLGREDLIARLSGTTDRSSREWKRARDNVSRWRRGTRHPSEANRTRLGAAAKDARRQTIRTQGRASVRLSGTFRTSRNLWGYAAADLTGDDLRDFLDAEASGDMERSSQIIADAYGLDPEYVIEMREVDGFDFEF